MSQVDDLDACRDALVLAARGNDVDAIALAAGALIAALIRRGRGRYEWETLLADLATPPAKPRQLRSAITKTKWAPSQDKVVAAVAALGGKASTPEIRAWLKEQGQTVPALYSTLRQTEQAGRLEDAGTGDPGQGHPPREWRLPR